MTPADLLGRCSFPDDDPLHLAVSGGADSTAMAVLAAELRRPLVIWHVHHGLRATAGRDAELVAKLAADLGADHEERVVELTPGPDLEARARSARYAALPPQVCVGHTADDRAETMLFNLFRGAGPAGVAARMDRFSRPLLALRRAETTGLCVALGLEVVDDEMNHDPAFARVRVRRELLPTAADVFDRDPVPLLNRHADLLADALAVVDEAAAQIDATDVAALRTVAPAVAAQALRRWIASETDAALAVDRASIDRVMAVVAGSHVATEIEGGHRVARTAGRLRLERRTVAHPDPTHEA